MLSSAPLEIAPEPVAVELERLARLARRALNTPISSIIWLDPAEGIQQANSNCDATGFSGDAHIPELAYEVAKKIAVGAQPLLVRDARDHPQFRHTSVGKEGGVVSCIAVPIRNTRSGKIIGSLSCFDVSPRTWTEEDAQVLSHLGGLVDNHLASYLNTAAEVTGAKAGPAASKFWETANYEFRTPLKLISEASRVLNELKLEGKSGALVGTIARSSLQLLAITDGLIRVYERGEDGAEIQKEKPGLVELVENAVLPHRPQAASKGIPLTVEDRLEAGITPDLDQACLAEVIDDLVARTVAANTQGEITIELESDAASNVVIKIKDTDLGIARQHDINLLTRGLRVHEGAFEETPISSLIPLRVKLASINGSLKLSGKLGVGSQYEIKLETAPPAERRPVAPPSPKSRLLTCLECGEEMSLLRRHLKLEHDLTPEAYRKKWNLPETFSMASPVYELKRSAARKE